MTRGQEHGGTGRSGARTGFSGTDSLGWTRLASFSMMLSPVAPAPLVGLLSPDVLVTSLDGHWAAALPHVSVGRTGHLCPASKCPPHCLVPPTSTLPAFSQGEPQTPASSILLEYRLVIALKFFLWKMLFIASKLVGIRKHSIFKKLIY